MECPHIPEINYRKFSNDIHSKAIAKRIPINGTIEITHRCNLNCLHCYCNLAANDKTADRKEMKYKEICDAIDQLVEEGCLWLLITGGEPLLREDFSEIYTYAKKKGLIITLFTNSIRISPKIADLLKELPPFNVEVSIYGATKSTHDTITRISGSFEATLRGVKLLLSRSIPLKLKTVVMNLNKDELFSMQRLAEDLGVNFSYDLSINPRLNNSLEPCKLRLEPEEWIEFYFRLADKKSLRRDKALIQKKNQPIFEFLYNCGAGSEEVWIDPYGRVCLCSLSRTTNFSLREFSFKRIYREFLPKILSHKISVENKCRKCRLAILCGQCPGWSQLENKDPEEPVKYFCQIAYLLWAKLQGGEYYEKALH